MLISPTVLAFKNLAINDICNYTYLSFKSSLNIQG